MIIPISDTQGHSNLVSMNTAMPTCGSVAAPKLAIHPLLRLLAKLSECEEAAGNAGSHAMKMIYLLVQMSEYEHVGIVDQTR